MFALSEKCTKKLAQAREDQEIELALQYARAYPKRHDKNFHSPKIFNCLEPMAAVYENIKKEALAIEAWTQWPENYFQGSGEWSVFPFYGFGKWAPENCKQCPFTAQLLKTLPSLKTAGFSRLGPQTTLTKHRGWGQLSNHVLRCHLTLQLPLTPKRVGIWVEGEFQQHVEGQWLVFDDSKWHTGINETEENRIILILDLERPDYIPLGTSKVSCTQELDNFLKEMK